MSKRVRRLALCTAVVAAVAVPAVAIAAATSTVLTTHNVKRGTVVASPSGLTLYGFLADKNGKPTCYSTCAGVWPPLMAINGRVAVKSGSGLNPKLVGRVKRANGKYQVTYGGKPLYRYYKDKKPGQQNGQNLNQFGARWYVIGKGGGYLKPTYTLVGGY
jgi:predicted lipoprotein with Yx(FWY)xxD motif